MERRTFFKQSARSALLLSAARVSAQDAMSGGLTPSLSSNAATVPKRPYSDTAVQLSVIGFGGIAVSGTDQEEANRFVAEAIERGVNYFDVAPTYGNAEERLGPALAPYRKRVFLACKTTERQRGPAEAEFRASLKRLRIDYFDLYQLHGITSVEDDVDPVFVKGGVMDMLVEAKKAGRVRHIGFSAHSEEAALAALDRYDFDSVLFPVNFATYYEGGFGPRVIKRAQEQGAALLALKAMARQKWPEGDPQRDRYSKCWYQPLTDPAEAELGLRWTLSQAVASAIPPGEWPLFRLALDIASRFSPVTEAEESKLKALAATLTPIFRPS